MSILTQSDPLQQKSFIAPQADIRLLVRLTRQQGEVIATKLKTRHAALCELSAAGKLQIVLSAGFLRIAAIRGGVLPVKFTQSDVQAVVDEVKAEIPDPAHWQKAASHA